MSALVFQNLAFDLGPRKLVIFRVDRQDLPHLTVSWDNPSGEVDIHLTQPGATSATDRDPIAKFPQSHLPTFAESFGRDLLEIVKTSTLQVVWQIKPSWLAKRQFSLFATTGESIEQWIHRCAPKIRGKHRLDADALKKMPEHARYSPTPRRFAQLAQQGMIYAVCKKGPDRGRVLILVPVVWLQGPASWIAADYYDVQTCAQAILRLLKDRWRRTASTEAKRVYDALHLREIGW
jgi:hypothetical protein